MFTSIIQNISSLGFSYHLVLVNRGSSSRRGEEWWGQFNSGQFRNHQASPQIYQNIHYILYSQEGEISESLYTAVYLHGLYPFFINHFLLYFLR